MSDRVGNASEQHSRYATNGRPVLIPLSSSGARNVNNDLVVTGRQGYFGGYFFGYVCRPSKSLYPVLAHFPAIHPSAPSIPAPGHGRLLKGIDIDPLSPHSLTYHSTHSEPGRHRPPTLFQPSRLPKYHHQLLLHRLTDSTTLTTLPPWLKA